MIEEPNENFWGPGIPGTTVTTNFTVNRNDDTTTKVDWLRENVSVYGTGWLYVDSIDNKRIKINFRHSDDALRFKLMFGV